MQLGQAMQLGIEILKQRTLQLPQPLTTAEAGKAIMVLCEVIGIRGVRVEGSAVHVTYDLVQVKPEEIKAGIAAAAGELGQALMETLHAAFVASEDAEVRKSAASCTSCG